MSNASYTFTYNCDNMLCNSHLTWRPGTVWVFYGESELLDEVTSVEVPLLPDVQQSFHVLFTVLVCITAGQRGEQQSSAENKGITTSYIKIKTLKKHRKAIKRSKHIQSFYDIFSKKQMIRGAAEVQIGSAVRNRKAKQNQNSNKLFPMQLLPHTDSHTFTTFRRV